MGVLILFLELLKSGVGVYFQSQKEAEKDKEAIKKGTKKAGKDIKDAGKDIGNAFKDIFN